MVGATGGTPRIPGCKRNRMRFVMRRDSGTADAINRSFERSRSSVGWAERVGRLLPWLRRGGGAERAGGYGSRGENLQGADPIDEYFPGSVTRLPSHHHDARPVLIKSREPFLHIGRHLATHASRGASRRHTPRTIATGCPRCTPRRLDIPDRASVRDRV